MPTWHVKMGRRVRHMDEERLRHRLRRGRLTGLELARPDGQPWAPLHTWDLYSEEIPHSGDTLAVAKRRSLSSWFAHLGVWLAVFMMTGLTGYWSTLGPMMLWGLFVALHGMRALAAVQEASGERLPRRIASAQEEGEGQPRSLPEVPRHTRRRELARAEREHARAEAERAAELERAEREHARAEAEQAAAWAKAEAEQERAWAKAEAEQERAWAQADARMDEEWTRAAADRERRATEAARLARERAHLRRRGEAIPEPPPSPAAPPPPSPPDPFLSAVDEALDAVRRAGDGAGGEAQGGDLDGVRDAAHALHRGALSLAQVVDGEAEARLREELEAVVSRAEGADDLTRDALIEQGEVIQQRLEALSRARVALARIEAQEQTLLHQLEALRTNLLLAAVDRHARPDLGAQLRTIRGQVEASAEVDAALARARRAQGVREG